MRPATLLCSADMSERPEGACCIELQIQLDATARGEHKRHFSTKSSFPDGTLEVPDVDVESCGTPSQTPGRLSLTHSACMAPHMEIPCPRGFALSRAWPGGARTVCRGMGLYHPDVQLLKCLPGCMTIFFHPPPPDRGHFFARVLHAIADAARCDSILSPVTA